MKNYGGTCYMIIKREIGCGHLMQNVLNMNLYGLVTRVCMFGYFQKLNLNYFKII